MLTLDIQTIKTLEQVKRPKRENQIKYKARQRKMNHIQRKRKHSHIECDANVNKRNEGKKQKQRNKIDREIR